jgi:hypothetical protein
MSLPSIWAFFQKRIDHTIPILFIVMSFFLSDFILEVKPACADPIAIDVTGKATEDGEIKITTETEKEGFQPPSEFTIPTASGEKAADLLDSVKAALDNDNNLKNILKIDRTNYKIGETTVERLTITPKEGIVNYSGVTRMPVNSPGLNWNPLVVSTAQSRSRLILEPGGLGDELAVVDWTLWVLDQSNNLLAESILPQVPNLTSATDLLEQFSQDLFVQGIDTMVIDNRLVMESFVNDYLFLSLSDETLFSPVLSNHIIPEPTTMLLLGAGFIGLVGLGRKIRKS